MRYLKFALCAIVFGVIAAQAHASDQVNQVLAKAFSAPAKPCDCDQGGECTCLPGQCNCARPATCSVDEPAEPARFKCPCCGMEMTANQTKRALAFMASKIAQQPAAVAADPVPPVPPATTSAVQVGYQTGGVPYYPGVSFSGCPTCPNGQGLSFGQGCSTGGCSAGGCSAGGCSSGRSRGIFGRRR